MQYLVNGVDRLFLQNSAAAVFVSVKAKGSDVSRVLLC